LYQHGVINALSENYEQAKIKALSIAK